MPAPNSDRKLTPEVRDYILQQLHWETCATDNPASLTSQVDNLKKDVLELKNQHKLVLGIATFFGAIASIITSLWKHN